MSGGGGSSGGPSNVTTTSTTVPWGPLGDYMKQIYPLAWGNMGQSSVVPWSPETQAGMSLTTSRALAGSPLVPAAQAQQLGTIGGSYLYGGPGFNAAYDAAANRIMPQVNSQFSLAGRYGGGLHESELTRQLGDSFAGLYGGERSLQQQSALQAPATAEADYSDIQKLLGVGASREALAQQYAQQPNEQLARAASIIYGAPAGQSTTETGPNKFATTSSPLMGALGGGLLGSSVGPMVGSGLADILPQSAMLGVGTFPWGMAGAGAGALLGALK